MNVNEASRRPIVECAVQPLLQRLESYHQLAKNSALDTLVLHGRRACLGPRGAVG
jgi:hypothetical protein